MRFTIRQARGLCLMLLACVPLQGALAQSQPVTVPAPAETGAQPSTTAPAAGPEATTPATPTSLCCALPDGTLVELAIGEPLSSKTAQRGQRFKLVLAEPLRLGDTVLVPAGTEGVGEVVHAERARGGGKAGELILAARFIEGPGGEIKLRGMKLGGIGKDNRDAANGLLIGTAVAAPILAPVAFLVRGGQIEIPAGTRAHAKLAGALQLPPLAPTSEESTGSQGAVLPEAPPKVPATSPTEGLPGTPNPLEATAPPAPPAGMDGATVAPAPATPEPRPASPFQE
jgi:hypothetical protein